MRFSLRTLLILTILGPPALAFAYGLLWVLGKIYARAITSGPY